MTEESPIAVLAVVVVLINCLVGLAALVLLVRDRAPISFRAKNTFLGWVTLSLGFIILLWISVLIFTSTREVRKSPQGLLGLVLPLSMVVIGWYWVREENKGVQDQDIDHDSPELRESVIAARAQLPRFIEQVMHHPHPAYIRFPVVTRIGDTERLWAIVHGYKNGKFDASILAHSRTVQKRQDVPESDVEDWQVLRPDGKVIGVFSMIASFRYLENKGVRLNRKMRKQKAQLIDA